MNFIFWLFLFCLAWSHARVMRDSVEKYCNVNLITCNKNCGPFGFINLKQSPLFLLDLPKKNQSVIACNLAIGVPVKSLRAHKFNCVSLRIQLFGKLVKTLSTFIATDWNFIFLWTKEGSNKKYTVFPCVGVSFITSCFCSFITREVK